MGELFRENGTAAAGEHGVDAGEDVGGGLDLAGVHCEEDAGGPVEEARVDGGADCFDDFAGEATIVDFLIFRGGQGKAEFFKEDSNPLDGFGAEGTLGGGELEGVGDFVGEGVLGKGGGCGI